MTTFHSAIFDKFKAAADAGKLHHAHLFLGPKGVGKGRMALHIAYYLQGAADDVMQKKLMHDGVDVDTLLFLDNGETLPIAEIRKLIARVQESHSKPYLVIVIENISRMRVESLNALLKTLEEPREGVIFFLTANRDEEVLPTIRSRCQITNFQTLDDESLREVCDGHVYTEQLVHFAMGRPSKLKKLINDGVYFEAHQKIHQDLMLFLENPQLAKVFHLVRSYEKDEHLLELFDILLWRVRGLARSKDKALILKHLDFTEMLENIEKAKEDLERNVNKRLVLENLFIPFVP
ncbi:AAA family ATPase [Candidatus Peregrinibacteria bacterium]|jgi:MoxR-like ATPase|nr:AAA family ATPase [Candidatus Peregrinibacteria bacterium]MBT4631809.1 AAA family ATPase [Candidatus Peregrinibacteria bacterium]MBT5517305.1 AAA family ATPase [Candidatus Peregrinibacteria bacterium]MBT5824466.1 AAA family ATPase [Candidatus Peregrinibacteria bacterium]